jgi:hypothetical protein
MRKFIALLLIVLPIFALGQVGSIDERPEYIRAGEQLILCTQRNWNFNEYLKTVYSFHANNNLYLLSYEDCNGCKRLNSKELIRNLYLYKLDNKTLTWTIASDVVKTDYYRVNNQKKHEYSYYYDKCNKDLSSTVHTKDGVNQGSVIVHDNGNVEMVIIYFNRKYDDYWTKDYFQWMKVIFIPTNNNNYLVKI